MDIYSAVVESTLQPNTTTVLMALLPTGRRMRLHSFSVSFNGNTVNRGEIGLNLNNDTAIGTPASTGEAVPLDVSSPTSPVAIYGFTSGTGEPTGSTTRESFLVKPTELFICQFPFGGEPMIDSTNIMSLKATNGDLNAPVECITTVTFSA